MVVEESSVVAAAASSAKFWAQYGGFKAEVISTKKIGQVHFIWEGNSLKLRQWMPKIKKLFIDGTKHLTANMNERGGGIVDIELIDLSHEIDNYYQFKATFETVDSMGANFINSVLDKGYSYRKWNILDRLYHCGEVHLQWQSLVKDCAWYGLTVSPLPSGSILFKAQSRSDLGKNLGTFIMNNPHLRRAA